MTAIEIALALVSGSVVGLSLGLVGGGGSILAVPLMVYGVGVSSPHVAIGTSAVVVTVNAFINLLAHAREKTVKWSCAAVFALAGMTGAAAGATLGKAVNGQRLLAGFGVLMIVVAALMLRPRRGGEDPHVRVDPTTAKRLLPPLLGLGFGVGTLSGFFGIGGGFLIVPGLVSATAMPLVNAIGSSLLAVAAFGATTAVSYAASGLVDWPLALLFLVGGVAGGFVGVRLVRRLAMDCRKLTLTFSGVVATVGIYVVVRGISALPLVHGAIASTAAGH